MRLKSFGKTDIGMRRKINQDAFLIDEELGLFVVADGMGGHAAGEVASTESVDAVHDMVLRGKDIIKEFREKSITQETSNAICRLLESAVQSATYLVYGMAEQRPGYKGMGTTVSVILLVGGYGITAQVGDTRIYCVRNNETIQLTEDHTLVNWQLREGVISPEEAKRSPHKNVITRAVGNKDYVQVDTQVLSIAIEDKFLICSDGLHGYLQKGEISKLFEKPIDVACKNMILLANNRGGKDNITAVAIEITDQ